MRLNRAFPPQASSANMASPTGKLQAFGSSGRGRCIVLRCKDDNQIAKYSRRAVEIGSRFGGRVRLRVVMMLYLFSPRVVACDAHQTCAYRQAPKPGSSPRRSGSSCASKSLCHVPQQRGIEPGGTAIVRQSPPDYAGTLRHAVDARLGERDLRPCDLVRLNLVAVRALSRLPCSPHTSVLSL